jgi:hypothetical protein
MTAFDVFNGDADGICALQQLRLESPAESVLVTGVKRDVRLLARVAPEPGDAVTVLDVSLDSNLDDLVRILDAGADVDYFDHHSARRAPSHPRLRLCHGASPDVCTSLLVDAHLGGRRRPWALVGAFGDGLDEVAAEMGRPTLSSAELESLRELGRLLNYNGYGRAVEDLHFPPDRLYRLVRAYPDPLELIAREPAFGTLREGYSCDVARLEALSPQLETAALAVYVLPDEAWARRAYGVLANSLARDRPDAAHAVLVPNSASCYMVSIRVPGNSAVRADEFCGRFDSGGGRATAGGINHLPGKRLDDFLRDLRESFG